MIIPILLIVLTFVTLVYLLAQYMKDSSIMDIFWGIGFIFVSISSAFIQYLRFGEVSLSLLLICALVFIWGMRLSIHIYLRHTSEDPRYVEWRNAWGKNYWWRSYFQIFLLQGVLLLGVSSSILALAYQKPLSLDVSTTATFLALFFGVCIWIIGFVFESLADAQLSKHIKQARLQNKPSTILKTGVWSYSRHPNYFGEAVLWWGIWIITLSHSAVPVYLSIIGPILITVLVRYVSGVPLTEKRMSQKSDFAEYAKQTPVFVPRFSNRCQ
jgi:steroid 5-alpha reductase family enzyme